MREQQHDIPLEYPDRNRVRKPDLGVMATHRQLQSFRPAPHAAVIGRMGQAERRRALCHVSMMFVTVRPITAALRSWVLGGVTLFLGNADPCASTLLHFLVGMS